MNTTTIQDAVRAIASNCDGASTEDGIGFNGGDTGFGKALAKQADEMWTPKMKHSAWMMMKKYKKQLISCGINYDEILEPEL